MIQNLQRRADSLISGFKKDSGAAVSLEAGALAAFSEVTFQENEAETAGPVASLSAQGSNGAAVWFHLCTFEDGAQAGAQAGEVVVDSRACRVFSNTYTPTVWDVDAGREVNPWLLAQVEDGETASSDVFQGLAFPTEQDAFFTTAAAAQAAATGLEEVTPTPLPDGSAYITVDPYPGESKFWTGRNIALVVGLGGTFIVLAVGVLLWYFCYFKPEGQTEPFGTVRAFLRLCSLFACSCYLHPARRAAPRRDGACPVAVDRSDRATFCLIFSVP